MLTREATPPQTRSAPDAASPPGGRGPLHGLPRFALTRVLSGALVLLVASILIFSASHILPGDPMRAFLGRGASDEAVAALREQLGLDRPLLEQYRGWLWAALHGDLGATLGSQTPISEILADRGLASLTLVAFSAGVSLPLGILLGIATARRHNSRFDHTVTVVSLTIANLPEFVVGMALVFLLATNTFQLFPATSVIPPGDAPWSHPEALALPVLTLALVIIPYLARMTRATMIEVLESDYIAAARLSGVREHRLVYRHAVVNGIAPTIQTSGLVIAYLFGGIVVVEYLFGYSGLGAALVDAVQNRDFVTVQAIALVMALSYIVINVIADVLTVAVSPRARTSLP